MSNNLMLLLQPLSIYCFINRPFCATLRAGRQASQNWAKKRLKLPSHESM